MPRTKQTPPTEQRPSSRDLRILVQLSAFVFYALLVAEQGLYARLAKLQFRDPP